MDFASCVRFIKSLYPGENPVPLHAPRFLGNEKRYLADCIDSTFVSYAGEYVTRFERLVAERVGACHAVATVNGTEALHAALLLAGVRPGDLVVTQPLTFVATCNAIVHCGAEPVFVDVERSTLGMSPTSLEAFLSAHAVRDGDGVCRLRSTGRRIAACVPMHTFGHPARIEEIVRVCAASGIPVVEDAAEGIGSLRNGRHVGAFGACGIFSFNGNKPVTTGGGGMIVTDDAQLAARARHVTTTAKVPHPWEFVHDEVGYNLRMPNVNAAIGCAQMERLDATLANKRETAARYASFCTAEGIAFVKEPAGCASNYWLNALVLDGREERDAFLAFCSANGVQARPAWRLMTELPMYARCNRGPLEESAWLADRIVNVPSSVRLDRPQR